MNITRLKIPTGRRQTSWLYTKRGRGFELGTTEKQIQLVAGAAGAGLEPGTSRLQHKRPKPLGHACLPKTNKCVLHSLQWSSYQARYCKTFGHLSQSSDTRFCSLSFYVKAFRRTFLLFVVFATCTFLNVSVVEGRPTSGLGKWGFLYDLAFGAKLDILNCVETIMVYC